MNAYVTVIGDVLVVVRTLRSEDGAAMREEMTDYAARCRSSFRTARRELREPVAYSRPASRCRRGQESYREARVALGIARQLHH